MKLPVIQQINITNFDLPSLKEAFHNQKVGSLPLYLEISSLEKTVVEKKLLLIKEALDSLKLNSFFPYPFYIINALNIKIEGLNTLDSVIKLPKHYIFKIKRVKNREQALLNKSQIIIERINNHPLREELDLIHDQRIKNKLLKELTKETSIYHKILRNIKNHGEKENTP